VEVEGGKRLFAGCVTREFGERVTDLWKCSVDVSFQILQLPFGILPVVKRNAGIDRRKEVDELLVGPESPRIKLLVQPVQQIVSFH
jgi:hypothetical protein